MRSDSQFANLFAPAAEAAPVASALGRPWQVLLVDDEPDMHAVLRLALSDLVVDGCGLQLMTARSADEARQRLKQVPDIALILLDVVMETESAGLDLVRHIRQGLGNHRVQIILVTGQPGYAPQRDVVIQHEINGYRLKSELTADNVVVSVCTALRTVKARDTLEQERERLQAETQALEQQQRQLARYQIHLQRLVKTRTEALESSSQHLAETQFAMDRAGIAIAWTDLATGIFLYVNDEACRQLGYLREELLTMAVVDVNPLYPIERLREVVAQLGQSDHLPPLPTVHRRKDGSEYPAELTVYLRRSADHDCLIIFCSDITERRRAESEAQAHLLALTSSHEALAQTNAKLTQAHTQLLQSEKMASLGLLAAGVAHEINNPIGFVKSNLRSLAEYTADFQSVLDAYAAAEARLPAHAAAFAEVRRLADDIDLPFVAQDLRALLSESSSGLERVAKIVQDLRDFSRLDCDEDWALEDIHQGLESTINVIWNQLKHSCEVQRDYGVLPPVECLLSQLNQVFLNLLVNAAQAIETRGTILIRTRQQGDEVWIEVRDTGCGIAPQNLQRIFDPFFTTKPVGQGTGLGLSIAYSIAQKHHGRIQAESLPGQGSCVRLCLPVRQPVG
jgi:PAS domain S-box-containing protein